MAMAELGEVELGHEQSCSIHAHAGSVSSRKLTTNMRQADDARSSHDLPQMFAGLERLPGSSHVKTLELILKMDYSRLMLFYTQRSGSSSSSGSGMAAASAISCSYCLTRFSSTWTSGACRAVSATNSRLGWPVNFLASQRKGFSKL